MERPPVTRRNFLAAAAAGAGGLAAAARGSQAAEPQARRPNFVYIFSDQQHWQAMGCVDPFFDTPHLDAFASDAAVFERAFCTTPQCSPSRSSMFTGLYPSKTGVMGNVGAAGGLPLRTESLDAMLEQSGYHTAYYGKWHLGDDPAGSAGWSEDDRRQNDPVTTEKATAFLASPRAQQGPFAMVVSYLDPHDVYNFRRNPDPAAARNVVLPESWHKETFQNKPPVQKQFMTDDQGTAIWDQPEEIWQWYREFYRGKVKLFDDGAGRVLAALRAAGLWENTIVVISSDHGDMDANHRLIFKGPFMYEHMIRVPMMVRVPELLGGALRGRVRDYDTVNVDLVPTIRDFAGLEPIDGDGLSLKPILTGAADPPKRDYVIAQYYSKQRWVNPIRTIRTSRFKLNKYGGDGQELYDLADDPHEIVNLADDPGRRTIRGELSAELDRWIETNDDPFYSLKPVPLAGRRGKPAAGQANR
jgi:arylsulfatase A-like enzyme